ncbi:component of SufBCD complex [Aliiroseovarius halocynthiae]|uniref:Component of SufBCD complex n=2 Tax=Aliiroseovarius halocynthiae TaxID=985055 RepID=A0A545SX93_9RHOB|nr:component of SufBCD complex [Aliiroseovarius halocynthiae]
MDLYATVFEVIDMRSFSNLWYWIALAVAWSIASHWVLGVPYDLVHRAARHEGQAQEDLEAIARVSCNRLLSLSEQSGIGLIATTSALLTSLGILGFWYGMEFAQAVFLLLLPMILVAFLSVRTAGRIRSADLKGKELRDRLGRHRLAIQIIGMISIAVTSTWGMFHILSYGVLR